MAAQNVITPSNLGNEFDLGVEETDKIHVKLGTGLSRDGTGKINASAGGAPFTRVFNGTAAASQNLWGQTGLVSIIDWAQDSIDGTKVSFIGSNQITFTNAGEARVYFGIVSVSGTVNNRSTYIAKCTLYDSGDTIKDEFYTPSIYIRDDNNIYDSGGMSGQFDFPVLAGDYIQIDVEVLDENASSGNQDITPSRSKIKVDFK